MASMVRCLEPECGSVFRYQSILILHLKTIHNIKFSDEQVVAFTTFDEFEIWFRKLQRETNTQFQLTTKKVNPYYTRIKYYCHRSGISNVIIDASKGSHAKRKRKKSTCKIGAMCTAYFCADQYTTGIIIVRYLNEHYGHENDVHLKYIKLPKDDRENIIKMLKMGLSSDEILEITRQEKSLLGQPLRINYINRRDIYDIKKQIGFEKGHKDDRLQNEEQSKEVEVEEENTTSILSTVQPDQQEATSTKNTTCQTLLLLKESIKKLKDSDIASSFEAAEMLEIMDYCVDQLETFSYKNTVDTLIAQDMIKVEYENNEEKSCNTYNRNIAALKDHDYYF